MGAVFGFLFGLWVLGAIVTSPYFWVKRTDRSQAPLVRRLMAVAYGMTWPYLAYSAIAGGADRTAKTAELDAATDRILGNAEPRMPSSTAEPAPKIRNPFD